MRVAAVFAHPDDEAFAAGGLLARAAERGSVQLFTATRGEAGSARDGDDAPLGERRQRELEASCEALGIAAPVQLGLPDGTLTRSMVAEALELGGFEVVITLGADGAYGHRDHLAVTAAVDALAAERVLHAVFPQGLFGRVHRTLRRLGAPVERRERWGVARDVADWVFALTPALRARKEAALAAHRSQLVDGAVRSFLRRDLVVPLLEEEWWCCPSRALIERVREELG